MMLCASISATLHATRVFKIAIPIKNTSEYPITIEKSDGTTITIPPNESPTIGLRDAEIVRIRALIGNHDVIVEAGRNKADLAWTINVDQQKREIKVERTQQQVSGRVGPQKM